MNSQQTWHDFWESVDNGEHGDVEGLIWQKRNGQWIMMIGDPQRTGRVIICGGIKFNPWSGEELSTIVSALAAAEGVAEE